MQFQLSTLSGDEFEQKLTERWPQSVATVEPFQVRYLDTFDWRLYLNGLMLSVEQVDEAWRLELSRFKQAEVLAAGNNATEPDFLQSFDDAQMRQSLSGVMEMRRLLPQVQLQGERRQIGLLDEEEKTLVRLELISAVAATEAGESVALAPLIRVIGLKGYEEEQQQLLKWLDQLQGVSDSADFYPGLLAAVQANAGAYSAKLNFSLQPDQRADAATKQILHFLLDVIEVNRAGVEADIDSEFLHDLRVAVRRTRSALSQIKEVFEPTTVEHFKQEFGWLGQVTGPTRDMDVYLLKFPDYLHSLPEEYRNALEPFHRYLEKHQASEQKKLARRLQGKRLTELLEQWRAFLDLPVPNVSSHANAVRPVLEVANRRIYKMYKRVMREGRMIDDDSHPEELHELRKSCKKLRYLMEFFQSLYSGEEIKGLIKSIKVLLDNLGDFQDLQVQAKAMKAMSEEMRQSQVGTDTLLAIGMLIDDLLKRQHEERDRFGQRFTEFNSADNRALFNALFKSGGKAA